MSYNENSELRHVQRTFMIIYFLYMSARALFNPYVTLFLREKGFEPAVIGMITATNSLVTLFAQPIWGMTSDKMGSVKRTLMLCMLLQAVMALLMKNAAELVMVTVLYCLFGFFSSPEGPMLDTWSLTSLKRAGDGAGVGRLKLLGCIGYSACSVFSALATAKAATAEVLPVYAMVLVGTVVLLSFVKEHREGNGSPGAKLHLGSMLKNKPFLLLLIYMFFMQIPHRAGYTFFSTYITELGGPKSYVGLTSAVMFLSEGLVLYFSRPLIRKVQPQWVVLGSAAFFFLWQVLYSVIPSSEWIIGIALLDGPSYGLFCIGVLYYMDVLAPQGLRTTYQTVAYAIYFGLAGIAGNALGGLMIDSVGYHAMYAIGATLTAISSIVFYLAIKKHSGGTKHARISDCR